MFDAGHARALLPACSAARRSLRRSPPRLGARRLRPDHRDRRHGWPTRAELSGLSPCQAVSRTTGFQVRVGAQRGLSSPRRTAGSSRWSITLGNARRSARPRSSRTTSAAPPRRGSPCCARAQRYFGRVTGRSRIQRLAPYFGTTVQFPLDDSLPVKAGLRVALTVPTWAPRWRSGSATTRLARRAARTTTAATPEPGRRRSRSATSARPPYRCVHSHCSADLVSARRSSPSPAAPWPPSQPGTDGVRTAQSRARGGV